MKISEKGLDLIKKYEGFRNHPYLCPAGVATIGYGNTFYGDGTRVKMTDPPVTKKTADALLRTIVAHFERGVNELVKKEITQSQFDALVSFAYNVGLHALKTSTLLRKVNLDPDHQEIGFEFRRWNKAGGKVLKGLSKRRNEEAWLYFEHIRTA